MKSIFFTKNVEGGVFINSSCTCDRVKISDTNRYFIIVIVEIQVRRFKIVMLNSYL
jgi:hypothetical protein